MSTSSLCFAINEQNLLTQYRFSWENIVTHSFLVKLNHGIRTLYQIRNYVNINSLYSPLPIFVAHHYDKSLQAPPHTLCESTCLNQTELPYSL